MSKEYSLSNAKEMRNSGRSNLSQTEEDTKDQISSQNSKRNTKNKWTEALYCDLMIILADSVTSNKYDANIIPVKRVC